MLSTPFVNVIVQLRRSIRALMHGCGVQVTSPDGSVLNFPCHGWLGRPDSGDLQGESRHNAALTGMLTNADRRSSEHPELTGAC